MGFSTYSNADMKIQGGSCSGAFLLLLLLLELPVPDGERRGPVAQERGAPFRQLGERPRAAVARPVERLRGQDQARVVGLALPNLNERAPVHHRLRTYVRA